MKLKTLQNKADKIWRTKGKEKAICEVCQRLPEWEKVHYTQLHPHHVVGRINRRLRWDLRNRVWLCPIHHTFGSKSAHNDPLWFAEWMKQFRSDDSRYLESVRNELVDVNLEYMEKIILTLEGEGRLVHPSQGGSQRS